MCVVVGICEDSRMPAKAYLAGDMSRSIEGSACSRSGTGIGAENGTELREAGYRLSENEIQKTDGQTTYLHAKDITKLVVYNGRWWFLWRL